MRDANCQSSIMILLEDIFPLIHSHHLCPLCFNSPIMPMTSLSGNEKSCRSFGMTMLSFKMNNPADHPNNYLRCQGAQETGTGQGKLALLPPHKPTRPRLNHFTHPQGVTNAGSGPRKTRSDKATAGPPAQAFLRQELTWHLPDSHVFLCGAVNRAPFVTTKFTGKKKNQNYFSGSQLLKFSKCTFLALYFP